MSTEKSERAVVTRIAPSPTGHLHIGTARSALFNYIYAKHHNGSFIIRSEDTDRARSTTAFEEEIRDGLAWLGLKEDGFYRQSERGHIYRKYLEKLIGEGAAYISKEPSKREEGVEIEVIRLKNPNKTIVFEDEIRGEIRFDTTELGDFVIARDLDDALYHFVVVVDDHEMGVTHVIRGEDHISNTPRQILVAEALEMPRPLYAHLPLILGPDRSKMSKRHGAVSLDVYRQEGFLPGAMVNYLALLGWNPGGDQEIFTFEELIDTFDLSHVQKGGAIFNKEKLLWVNKAHLDTLTDEEFLEHVDKYIPARVKELPQYTPDRFSRLLSTIRERTQVAGDLQRDMEAGEYDFAFTKPQIDPEMIRWKKDDGAQAALPRLEKALEILRDLPEESGSEAIQEALWPYAEEVGKGELLWPLRVAITGKERSPGPFEVIYALGVTESIDRIKAACATIEG